MKTLKAIAVSAVLVFGSVNLTGCGYNNLQIQDEQVNQAWAEVVNQYKRRSDLVPSLVETVKGYATHEQDVFTQVTQARASIASIKATPELVNDEKAFNKFIEAQNQMQGALSRLMSISENYPELKANTNFRDLSAQLEGTENRIAVARTNYIEKISAYNMTVRQFPTNLTAKMFGLKTKAQFTVENEQAISNAPTVKF